MRNEKYPKQCHLIYLFPVVPSSVAQNITVTPDLNLARDIITLYVDFVRASDERFGYYDAVQGYRLFLASGVTRVREIDSITISEYIRFELAGTTTKFGVGIDGLRHIFEVYDYDITIETDAMVVAYNEQGDSFQQISYPIRDKGLYPP